MLIAKGAVRTNDIAAGAVAPNATRVGGIRVTPVKAALEQNDPDQTLLQIGSTAVKLGCGPGFAEFGVSQADASAPAAHVQYSHGGGGTIAEVALNGGPSSWGSGVAAQDALISIRASNNNVTPVQLDGFYALNEIGADDCFFQGTIERF